MGLAARTRLLFLHAAVLRDGHQLLPHPGHQNSSPNIPHRGACSDWGGFQGTQQAKSVGGAELSVCGECWKQLLFELLLLYIPPVLSES